MAKSYAFYDVANQDDTFHVQCEWFNKNVDLGQKEQTDYGVITATDLQDYWQCPVGRDLLVSSFPESNALFKEQRDNVLTAALLGEASCNGSRLEWKMGLSENQELQMRLRTFDGDIPLVAGSFLLSKVSRDKHSDLHKSWFINSAIASCAFTQANKALQQRITDISKTNSELKETIESMNIKESKNKFVMIDKFVRLLNNKKRKIFTLEKQIKTLNENLTKAKEEAEKKRKRDDKDDGEDDDEQEEIANTANQRAVKLQRTVKVQRAVKEETTSLPLLPVVNNDSDDEDDDYYCSDDDIDCPQTVR